MTTENTDPNDENKDFSVAFSRCTAGCAYSDRLQMHDSISTDILKNFDKVCTAYEQSFQRTTDCGSVIEALASDAASAIKLSLNPVEEAVLIEEILLVFLSEQNLVNAWRDFKGNMQTVAKTKFQSRHTFETMIVALLFAVTRPKFAADFLKKLEPAKHVINLAWMLLVADEVHRFIDPHKRQVLYNWLCQQGHISDRNAH